MERLINSDTPKEKETCCFAPTEVQFTPSKWTGWTFLSAEPYAGQPGVESTPPPRLHADQWPTSPCPQMATAALSRI